VKKLVFSPAGRETLIFRTFRQSYLIEFFQVCDRSDRMRSHEIACHKCDVACNIAAHYLGVLEVEHSHFLPILGKAVDLDTFFAFFAF